MSAGRVLDPENLPQEPAPARSGKVGIHRVSMRAAPAGDRVAADRKRAASADDASAGRVAVAGAWGLVGRGLMLVANLLATPFTIRLLGPARYGLWSILQTAFSWAATSDVSMGPATTKLGADCYARHDGRGESAVVWTALSVIAATMTPIAVLFIVFAPEILRLFGVHRELLSSGVLALRVGCGIFLLQAVAVILNTPPQIRLRWGGYTLISTCSNLIASIGPPVAIVLVSGGLVTASCVLLGAAAVLAIGNLVLAIRLQPLLRRPRFSKLIMKQLLSYGGALTVGGVVSLLLATAERFFLSSSHSTTVVAYWAVAANLATILAVLPEQLLAPLLPALARLETAGSFTELARLFHKALAGVFLILTPAAILLALVAQPFLTIWAGPAYGLHSTVLLLIALPGVWLDCMSWVAQSYLLSSGRTRVIAYMRIAELGPYLLAAWVLTEKYGAVGAALVWSGRLAAEALVVFPLVRRAAPLPLMPLSERRLAAIAGPLALCGAAVAVMIVSDSFTVRIAWAVGLGLGYTVACWRLILTPREREGVVAVLDEALRRGSIPRHSRAS